MTPTIPVSDKPIIRHNIPIVTFLSRTWMLAIFMLASNYAVLSKHEFWVKVLPDGTHQGVTAFELLGAVLYVPAIASVVMFVFLLIIHLFFRETIDKDAHDGTYIADWHALNSAERVWVSTIIRVGFFIGFCILCASMAKG